MQLPVLPDKLVPLASRTISRRRSRSTSCPTTTSPSCRTRRKLAIYTAVNINGKTRQKPKRLDDRWFFDPRVPKEEQTGQAVYEEPARPRPPRAPARPGLGQHREDGEARQRRHVPLHQLHAATQGLQPQQDELGGPRRLHPEDAANLHFKANVFTGPVLDENDDAYEGVQLPRQFWKVVTMVKTDRPQAVGHGVPSEARNTSSRDLCPARRSPYGAYKTYQVPVKKVEKLSGLSFGLVHADPLSTRDIGVATKELDKPADMALSEAAMELTTVRQRPKGGEPWRRDFRSTSA